MGLLDFSLTPSAVGWLDPNAPAQPTPLSTPQQDQQRQQMAQQLLNSGSNYSPVQSAWQGAARLGEALSGAIQMRRAQQQQQAGQASANAALANLLGGNTGGTPPANANAALGNALAGTQAAPAPPQGSGGGSLPSFAALQGAPGGTSTANLFAQQEQAHGLPPGFLAQSAQIESRGNPNAYNKGSGAAGLFQFVPSTAKQYGLGNPYDVVASTNAAAQLAGDNAASLTKALGQAPTAGQLYLAHQQGAGGAAKLLTNPSARAGDIVGDAAVRSNGGDPNMTAGQFASLWTSRFDGGGAPQAKAPIGLPMMAATPGMASLPPSGGGFGPIGTGTPSAQPAAMAFAPQPSAMTAPASQAITGSAGPAGGAQAYGSQPLNINGKMLTRQQAEDTDGLDHTDYDYQAARQGLIGNPAAAPAFADGAATSSVLPAASAGSASSPASSVITGTPAAAPSIPQQASAAAGGMDPKALLAVLQNPYSSPAAVQVASTLYEAQMKRGQVDPISINNKLVDRNTGRVLGDFSDSKSDARPVTAAERQAYGLPATGAFEIQDGKVFGVPGTFGKDVAGGAGSNHVIGPGGALVDNAGHALYTNSGSEGGGLDDATVNSLANRVYLGDTTALTGLSRGAQGSANIAKVQARVAQIAAENQGKPKPVVPEGDILTNRADQMGEQAGARASGTLNARMDTYAAEASSTMNQAIEASRALPRGGWKPVNEAVQYVQNKGNDPRYAAFNAQTNAVINTYAKAINPTGVPTDSDKQHAREVLSTAQSPEAYEATIRQLQREINVAHTAARGARAAERSGAAGENMPVAAQNDAAPGATSGGFWNTIMHPFGGGSAAPEAAPVQIQGAEDYAKLPSGAHYIDPTGKARVKQ